MGFIDTTPLLMVVGGYNQDIPNGLTNDVEMLSLTPNNLCTKRARPLPTRAFDFGTHIEKDAATLGMTGLVINVYKLLT